MHSCRVSLPFPLTFSTLDAKLDFLPWLRAYKSLKSLFYSEGSQGWVLQRCDLDGWTWEQDKDMRST